MRYLSRNEFERRALLKAAEAGLTPDGIDRWREHRYPLTTDGAVDECRQRGIAVGEPLAMKFANDTVGKFGGSFAWRRDDIDAMLHLANGLRRTVRTRELILATERGVSLATWLRMVEVDEARRINEQSRLAGLSDDELRYALGTFQTSDLEQRARILNLAGLTDDDRALLAQVVADARETDDFRQMMQHTAECRARRLAMANECDRRGIVDDEVAA